MRRSPVTVLHSLHLYRLIFTTQGGSYYYPHFTAKGNRGTEPGNLLPVVAQLESREAATETSRRQVDADPQSPWFRLLQNEKGVGLGYLQPSVAQPRAQPQPPMLPWGRGG